MIEAHQQQNTAKKCIESAGFNGVVALPRSATLEMVCIRAGSFWMGSPSGETGVMRLDETRHYVTLSKDFMIGKYPVTQSQYEAVMGTNPSAFKTGGNHPVECVSWKDAMRFCARLNVRFAGILPAGYRFSLPLEAQWEYACRAGSESALYNGKELTSEEGKCLNLDEIAWYVHNHSSDGHMEVGLKQPNDWGLYDMLGNIHEWVFDRYGHYSADKHETLDPKGSLNGRERVVRGGSWKSPPWRCRAARRGIDEESYRLNGLGFRLALIADTGSGKTE